MTCAGPPPSGVNLKNISTEIPFLVEKILDIVAAIVRWYFGMYHVKFDSVLMKANGDKLERIRGWVEEGRIQPVVGKVLKFANLEGIKHECMRISKGNGGVGKVVIEIISE